MNTRRIVITGGPGTGKTTLISHLETAGAAVLHEISRQVTAEAQRQGIEQLFLKDPTLFSSKLLAGRLKQFKAAEQVSEPHLFYDRGLPDVTAYMNYLDTPYDAYFDDTCNTHRYDQVFLLPPWEAIYRQDQERYESFEQALELYTFLKTTYQGYGYCPIEVPRDKVTARIEFINQHLIE
ncbi:ATP-binding protein [Altibacter sp. HG106]|uniref:ATP-binding protein n=1 Tax=Altibacter sp. HG106 TaxID=3023937 RepID=UPI002350A230|nr:ATP-binding protein [Altibacter sp. HG106]MDC7993712.1 ATP-binding protein [Altibacter sp. HG106]